MDKQQKECRGCKAYKLLKDFSPRCMKCKSCMKAIHEKRVNTADKNSICNKCNIEKTNDCFYLDDQTCKECRYDYNKNRIYDPKNNYFYYRKRLCDNAKVRARHKKILCTLTPDDIVIPSVCPVFGIPLIMSQREITPNTPTIDRIDPNGDYTPQNIAVISSKANTIKSYATASELRLVAAWMESKTQTS